VWDIATAYTVGEHVWHPDTSTLYENVTNDTGTTPGTKSNIWLLVPSTVVTSELISDEEQEWRPMLVENTDVSIASSFTERTYKPKEAIINEFSTFSIKIELLTNSEVSFPTCKSLRCIALY